MYNHRAIESLEQAQHFLEAAALALAEGSLEHRKAGSSLDSRVESTAAASADHCCCLIASILTSLKQKLTEPVGKGNLTEEQLEVVSALVNLGTTEPKAKLAVCRAVIALPQSAGFDDLFKKALEVVG